MLLGTLQRRLQHDSIIGNINWIPIEVGQTTRYTAHERIQKFLQQTALPPAGVLQSSGSVGPRLRVDFLATPRSTLAAVRHPARRWLPSHNSAAGRGCRRGCRCWRRHWLQSLSPAGAAPPPLPPLVLQARELVSYVQAPTACGALPLVYGLRRLCDAASSFAAAGCMSRRHSSRGCCRQGYSRCCRRRCRRRCRGR